MKDHEAAPTLFKLMRSGQLDETVALQSLVAMNSSQARDLLMRRYREAKDDQARLRWLRLLNGYGSGTGVSELLQKVLTNPSRRAIWPQVIELASERSSSPALVSLFTQKLMDKNNAVVSAAWEALKYDLGEAPLPDEVMQSLRSDKNPDHRMIALRATYVYAPEDADQQVAAAVADPSPEVARLALGMIAKIHLYTAMGVEVPEWRRTGDVGVFGMGAWPTQMEAATDPSSSWRSAVRQVVDTTDDARLRTLAAAVLYRAGEVDDQAIRQPLHQALGSGDVSLQAIALRGIVNRPEPFMDELDLPALRRDAETRDMAVVLIGASGRPELIKPLLAKAKDATLSDMPLMRALIRSNDPDARALVLAKVMAEASWEQQEFVQQLNFASGPGPVAFIQAMLEQLAASNSGGGGWQASQIRQTLLTLDDPSVIKVLRSQLHAPGSDWDDGNNDDGRIIARLMQLDPAPTIDLIKKWLTSQDEQSQRAALQAVLHMPATSAIEQAALAAAKKPHGAHWVVDWRQLAEWVRPTTLRETWLSEIDKLPPSLQAAVLDRVAETLNAEDLPRLLAIHPDTAWLRSSVAGLVGTLLARKELSPPDPLPDTATGDELVTWLSALGDMPGGAAVVSHYLTDERPAVQAAAVRGLALSILRSPAADPTTPEQLTPTQLHALQQAVQQQKHPFTAYLASEALLHASPETLSAIESQSLAEPRSRLRWAVARSGKTPPVVVTTIIAVLNDMEVSTRTNLAMAALMAADPSAIKTILDRGPLIDARHRVPCGAVDSLGLAIERAAFAESVGLVGSADPAHAGHAKGDGRGGRPGRAAGRAVLCDAGGDGLYQTCRPGGGGAPAAELG